MTSRPFYMPDPTWWPTIADALPKPWPREAVEHDLVWWEDQLAVGRVERLPGRPALAARWGWGENAVRRMLVTHQTTTSDPPAIHQRITSAEKVEPAQVVPNHQRITSDPPAIHQQPTSEIEPVAAEVSALNEEESEASRACGTEHINTYNNISLSLPLSGLDTPTGPAAKAHTPPVDEDWELFAALAVEHGQVAQPPSGATKTGKGQHRTRAKDLQDLIAANGRERVFAVWRWVLMSKSRDALWWRTERKGPQLIGSFLVSANFAKLADGLDAERQPRPNPHGLVAVLTLDGLHPLDKLLAVMRRFKFDLPPEATFRAACGTDEHIDDVVDAAKFIGRGKFKDGWYKLTRNPDLIDDLRREWGAVESAESEQAL